MQYRVSQTRRRYGPTVDVNNWISFSEFIWLEWIVLQEDNCRDENTDRRSDDNVRRMMSIVSSSTYGNIYSREEPAEQKSSADRRAGRRNDLFAEWKLQRGAPAPQPVEGVKSTENGFEDDKIWKKLTRR